MALSDLEEEKLIVIGVAVGAISMLLGLLLFGIYKRHKFCQKDHNPIEADYRRDGSLYTGLRTDGEYDSEDEQHQPLVVTVTHPTVQ